MSSSETTNTKELWDNALVEVELGVSKANFNTWFKNTYVVKQEQGTIYLGVPNQFVKDWLAAKYHKFLLKILRDMSSGTRSLEYVIAKEKLSEKERVGVMPTMIGAELPLNELYINKEDNLNPRYDFESFVVGSFNELAHAASQGVLKELGAKYNPLFVYGHTGHGKTHLIQAVGNEVKGHHPNKKVYYLTSEKFMQDLISAIRSNTVPYFKEKYRKYDVFIMDDIQLLSGKERTQEELFHLFNTLYNSNRQIVFSSDQHPNFIPGLEDRLRSRFGAGMIVDIQAPDRESRIAILKTKAQRNNFSVTDEMLDYLSSVIEGNIRDLEGIFNSFIFQSQLKGRNLTLAEARDLVKNNVKPKRVLPVEDVVKIIADFYNVDVDSIYKKTRKKEVVKPRQLIMYILREDFSIPYPTIGQKLGGRDHTTVIHSYEKIKNNLKSDHSLEQEINQIRAMI